MGRNGKRSRKGQNLPRNSRGQFGKSPKEPENEYLDFESNQSNLPDSSDVVVMEEDSGLDLNAFIRVMNVKSPKDLTSCCVTW